MQANELSAREFELLFRFSDSGFLLLPFLSFLFVVKAIVTVAAVVVVSTDFPF